MGALNRTGQSSEKEPCRVATDLLCDLGAPDPVCCFPSMLWGRAGLECLEALSWLWSSPQPEWGLGGHGGGSRSLWAQTIQCATSEGCGACHDHRGSRWTQWEGLPGGLRGSTA